MHAQTKTNVLQSYHLVLYKRALHPELFSLKARRIIKHQGYEFEAWLMPGSHVLRFQHKGFCACELVSDRDDGLPTNGAVATFPCAGEKDYEHTFSEPLVNYLTTVQTETLNESLYNSSYRQIVELAGETNGLMHKWEGPDGGRCLSMLDIQRYQRELHVQSYHLVAQCGLVLRTQTIFEHRS
jgi:hypothetical protein